LGRYLPALSFFTMLLGDQPVLPLHARIYQRMLAMDPDEPDELAQKYLTNHSVDEFYGEVLMPALRFLEDEQFRSAIEPTQRHYVLESIRNLIEDVSDYPDAVQKQSPVL